MNIVGLHWMMEAHGMTSGMNSEKTYDIIPKEKKFLKDHERFMFIHAHFGTNDLTFF